MKQRSIKIKGKRLQNFVREKILKNFPHLKKKDVVCVENGIQGPDIILSKVGMKLCPFQFEVKNQEKLKGIYQWYRQANKNIPKGLTPVVVCKRNAQDPLVIIDLKTFLELIK